MNHFAVFKVSFLALMLTTAIPAHSNELSLDEALSYALDNEPWLTASKYCYTSTKFSGRHTAGSSINGGLNEFTHRRFCF